MSLHDIIAQLLERGNAMQTFWGFYITVSLGLIVFFGNAKRSSRLPYLAGLVSLAFVAFAYVNWDGMTDVVKQRNVLWGLLDGYVTATGDPTIQANAAIATKIKSVAKPPTPEEVKWFHFGSDVAVLLAIWFLTLWPIKEGPVMPQVEGKAPEPTAA
jgi:hypothetical protein